MSSEEASPGPGQEGRRQAGFLEAAASKPSCAECPSHGEKADDPRAPERGPEWGASWPEQATGITRPRAGQGCPQGPPSRREFGVQLFPARAPWSPRRCSGVRTVPKGWVGAETEVDARPGPQTASEGGRVGVLALANEGQRAGGWRPVGTQGSQRLCAPPGRKVRRQPDTQNKGTLKGVPGSLGGGAGGGAESQAPGGVLEKESAPRKALPAAQPLFPGKCRLSKWHLFPNRTS